MNLKTAQDRVLQAKFVKKLCETLAITSKLQHLDLSGMNFINEKVYCPQAQFLEKKKMWVSCDQKMLFVEKLAYKENLGD